MKRVVDLYSNDWSHEILWTYIIEIGDKLPAPTGEDFECEALRQAIKENREDTKSMFAKARE